MRLQPPAILMVRAPGGWGGWLVAPCSWGDRLCSPREGMVNLGSRVHPTPLPRPAPFPPTSHCPNKKESCSRTAGARAGAFPTQCLTQWVLLPASCFAQEQMGELGASALKMVKQMSLEENLTKV